jgi:hypothetical protein
MQESVDALAQGRQANLRPLTDDRFTPREGALDEAQHETMAREAVDEVARENGDDVAASSGERDTLSGAIDPDEYAAQRFSKRVSEDMLSPEVMADVVAKHGLTDIADKKSGMNGVKLFHGDSVISKDTGVDSIIQPAQDIINTARPKGETNVNRSEAFKAWSESLGGSAREIARRAREAFSRIGGSKSDRERAARREAEGLRRAESVEPGSVRERNGSDPQHLREDRFNSPDENAAAEFKKVADKHNLTPAQRERYAPKINRDELSLPCNPNTCHLRIRRYR